MITKVHQGKDGFSTKINPEKDLNLDLTVNNGKKATAEHLKLPNLTGMDHREFKKKGHMQVLQDAVNHSKRRHKSIDMNELPEQIQPNSSQMKWYNAKLIEEIKGM